MFEQITQNEEREHRQSIVYLAGFLVIAFVLFAIVLLH